MSLRKRLLTRLAALAAPVQLRVVFPEGEAIELDSNPKVILTLRSRAVVRALLTGRMDKLGDAYAAGEIGVEGSLHDVLETGIALAERMGRVSRLASPFIRLAGLAFRHTKGNDAAAIHSHYDV